MKKIPLDEESFQHLLELLGCQKKPSLTPKQANPSIFVVVEGIHIYPCSDVQKDDMDDDLDLSEDNGGCFFRRNGPDGHCVRYCPGCRKCCLGLDSNDC